MRVSAERCNISLIDRDFKFNRNDPGGTHVLNLDLPFERAVAFKILQIIAVNTSYRVSARYDAPISTIARKVGNNKSKEDFKLIRGFSDHKVYMNGVKCCECLICAPYQVKVMDREQVDLMSRLKRVARASLDMEMAVALFNEFDEDGSGNHMHLDV